MTVSNTLLVITATCTALMAGLFFSYSCSVIPAMKMLPDTTYIASMQSVNKVIQNLVFFIVFFGAILSLPVSTYLSYSQESPTRFWLLLAATVVYLGGVFGVTALGNIPLNNALEKFNLANASIESIHLQRENFEARWNSFNFMRTIAAIVSLVLVILACTNGTKSIKLSVDQ